MKVVPIASTQLHTYAIESETPYKLHDPFDDQASVPSHIDELHEVGGRNCYTSFHRPNPDTATNESYMQNIIDQAHYSVMEHGSVSFYVESSRSLLTELSRHRFLSFSVVSQRYVDANKLGYIVPPIVEELRPADQAEVLAILDQSFLRSMQEYNKLFDFYKELGYERKQCREAARAVLPNMINSPMVVTGNIRAWRDVLSKRYHVAADKEIQQFATQVLGHLRVLAPNSVQDIGGIYGE